MLDLNKVAPCLRNGKQAEQSAGHMGALALCCINEGRQ